MVTQKTAIESLYTGTCTIITRSGVQNPITKRTEFGELTLYEDQPCKLSYKTLTSANEKTNVTEVKQVPKLFISNEINVPPGSKITVTQNGVTKEFGWSGEPGVFSGHQEIILELFRGWA